MDCGSLPIKPMVNQHYSLWTTCMFLKITKNALKFMWFVLLKDEIFKWSLNKCKTGTKIYVMALINRFHMIHQEISYDYLSGVSTEDDHQTLRSDFLPWQSRIFSRQKKTKMHCNVYRLGQIATRSHQHFNHGWLAAMFRNKNIIH